MKGLRIGIIREGKIPSDFRAPLTPMQCVAVGKLFPSLKIVVQSSAVRAFKDIEYTALGIDVVEDLEDCDVVFGIKEVPIEALIPNKTFFFFSHTIKKQPYNRLLLKSILEKKIQLIDYEVIRDLNNNRLIGFGRYVLKPAHACFDRIEVENELKKVNLPADFRIVLTGFGRVGHGAAEIIRLLPIQQKTPTEFLEGQFSQPIYTQLQSVDYYANKLEQSFDKKHFYKHPENYISIFPKFLALCDMYIPCHFWDSRSPKIIVQADLNVPNRRVKVIADISCDTAGPIASTIRASKISDPIYGYDPATGLEVNFMNEEAVAVMAIDNLPCELPRDASEGFGEELIKSVLPKLLGDDSDRILERGSETNKNGELMPEFYYLKEYVSGMS